MQLRFKMLQKINSRFAELVCRAAQFGQNFVNINQYGYTMLIIIIIITTKLKYRKNKSKNKMRNITIVIFHCKINSI